MLAGTAPGYHPITEDAKQSIHSMCDLDYWAWSRVEIKINGWPETRWGCERQLVAILWETKRVSSISRATNK
jgi:hypothetical protein